MHRLLFSLSFCLVPHVYRIVCRLAARRQSAAVLAAIACVGVGGIAMGQPANDNFANAQVVAGANGTVIGSNVGATTETGEPPITGEPAAASIWYTWTAQASGATTFDTFGSTNQTGGSLDTRLAIYTGGNLGNLTLVGENDDAVNGATFNSSVTFTATAGTKYMIAVDGFSSSDQGGVVLNWVTGGLWAGDFRFTSSFYNFSDFDSVPTGDPRMSFITNRFTITRTGGSAGRVLINYTITNGTYTDLHITNVYGTNILLTNIDNLAKITYFTNIIVTNYSVTDRIQNMEYGQLIYFDLYRSWTDACTNIGDSTGNLNPFCSSTPMTNVLTTNVVPQLCGSNFITMTNIVGTNPPSDNTLISVTNYFCFMQSGTESTESALDGIEYASITGVLTNDDYQMGLDIQTPFFPILRFPPRNAYLVATINSVALDPLESTLIAPPTASDPRTNAYMNILDAVWAQGGTNAPPSDFGIIAFPGAGVVGTNVFNWERATIRCKEGIGQAHVWVTRGGYIPPGSSADVQYRIDYTANRQPHENANNFFRLANPFGTPPDFLDDFSNPEINLQPGSEYATPTNSWNFSPSPVDFDSVSGTLSFGSGITAVRLDFDIFDETNLVEFNEDLQLQLYFSGSSSVDPNTKCLGYVRDCNLTIMFDEQPAGAVDRDHNPDKNAGTLPPYNEHPGANNVVYSAVLQADGKAIIGGDFSAYNTTPINRLARVNLDGSRDTNFNPPGGANQFISSLALDSVGRILVGGAFTAFNGVSRTRLARVNGDGTLDTSFNPGLGANSTVWAIAQQSDGKIMVGGEFTSVNGTNRNYVARLGTNGVLDATFDTSNGPNGPVFALAVQLDGRVVIGGEFTAVGGVPRNHIARLNADGSLDMTFDPAAGADDIVYAVAVQTDGRIVIGGAFRNVQTLSRRSIARLNANGVIDLNFIPGSGADDTVYSISLQPDQNIIIAGRFSVYNETRRMSIARLFTDGTLDTSFMDTAYNQYAGLPKHYYDAGIESHGFVFSTAIQNDGKVIIGGGFDRVGGGGDRDDIRNRSNFARLIGGATPGPGNVQLAQSSYTADENGGPLFVTLTRTNGILGPATVSITPKTLPAGPGAAVVSNDFVFLPKYANPTYVDTWPRDTWEMSDGTDGQNQGGSGTVNPGFTLTYPNNDVFINIIDNTIIDGNRQLNLEVHNPRDNNGLLLGGERIPLGVALGLTQAPLTIVDNDTPAGTIGFTVSNFVYSEGAVNAVVSVIRTNGFSGVVHVNYSVGDGTAVAPGDYKPPIPNPGTLTFLGGVTNEVQTFTVKIVDDAIAEDDETINLHLFNPDNRAILGVSNAVITILDNDTPSGRVNFSSATYSTNENAGVATITVNRTGGILGQLAVIYASSDGTAIAGTDYTSVSNVLQWNDQETGPKTFNVPLNDDQRVNGPRTVSLRLRSPTIGGVTNANALNALGSISNAVLTIQDNDAYGTVAFTRGVYNVMENGGPAIVTVQRTGGIAQSVTVNFAAVGGTASPGFEYTPTNGVLTFGPGEISRSFAVPIIDNTFTNATRFVGLILSNATPAASLGFPQVALLNIIDDETVNEPAGSPDTALDPSAGFNGDVFTLALQTNNMILVGGDFTLADSLLRNRVARLNPDGTLDTSFSSPTLGANATVRSMIAQSDGRILIGGFFTNVNGVVNNHLARLNYDGTLDSTFNPGSGADNNVMALAETYVADGSRRLFIGGAFLNYNSVSRPGIARLNDDGTVDGAWDPGVSANGTVFAVVPYPTNSVHNGQVLIGGDFTTVGGFGRNHIARLNADGSVDTSFNPPSGADNSVRAILLQTDEQIVIGGLFTNVNGVARSRIARLTSDGTTDTNFNAGPGANDAVLALALQEDNKILVGGQFASANGVTRQGITRMNVDGSVDPSINFGLGADGFVGSLVVQPDDKILLGGGFTHYDGAPYPHFLRIYGRSINGSGTFEFDSANYSVMENGTNAVVTVRRRGGTAGFPTQTGNVFVTMSTSNRTAVAGVNYGAVVTNLTFPVGEVVANVGIPVIDDFLVNTDRTVNLFLSNLQPPGGPAFGNQITALLTIVNDDCAISFSSSTYSVNEDTGLGAAVITFVRTGSLSNAPSITFMTTTNGTAVQGVNYTAVSNVIQFGTNQSSAIVPVPVLHDPTPSGDKTVTMILTNAIGSVLVAPSQATLSIIDVESAPGQFIFAATNFYAAENVGDALVTVLRTNGHSGAVHVFYATSDGSALAGLDYVPTNHQLDFSDNQTVAQFNVHIIDNNIVQNPRSLNITLSNPSIGTTILPNATVPLTILDNDVGISLASPTFTVNEGNGAATISILRLNGSNGVVTVNYSTTNSLATNGLAIAGIDYLPTSGVLTFASNETFKTFTVPIVDNSVVDGNRTFGITISNVQPPSAAQLVTKFATVTILDNDIGFFFTNSVLSTLESSNLLVTVIRTNGSPTGTNSVVYSTSDGTATAGFDYTASSGVLTFTNGETVKTFVVPIIEDTLVEGDETFNISLTSPDPGSQLLSPSNTLVTIIDDDSGFKFSSPTYSVSEGGVRATINIIRTGILTNTVSVSFATSNGTATAGSDYFATNGTFVFTNGETAHAFTVQVIDDTTIEGDETVLLSLSNPSGQAGLMTPSAAVLTIVDNDGSVIAPAGAALIAESPPANGAIDTNETVTLLFGLRNSVGQPTANLVATLLATNGVTLPSAPMSYGVLVPGGPSASRPFSFKASGTNGGSLVATFQLQDGAVNLGTAAFSFTLGTNYYRFTNSSFITIRDNTNALPYPSTINVSGLNGVVAKATVTLTNFSHTHPNDVDIMLATPAGQNMLIVANDGGANAINNVMLTLDDDAPTPVPASGTIVTATNSPNPVMPVAAFPSPAPPAPYATNLAACKGSNPNGAWNLFVIDDTTLDSGSIASGWILTLTTASVVPGASDLVLGVTDAPDPAVTGSNVTYTISVTNFGPSTATDVVVSALLPNNANFVSASAGYTLNNNVVTFANIGNLATNAVATRTVVVQALVVGPMTNVVTASSLVADPNLADNTVASVTTVVPPSADLSLTLSDAPDPVVIGSGLNYTLTISNLGPATAASVRLTNTLPASVSFVSASPPGYMLSGNSVIFAGLGDLGSGGVITASITVNPTAGGEITDTATVSSTITDPLKANNTVAVKTIVSDLKLTVTRSGNNISISWPASAANYILESANTLNAPITWNQVTTPPAQFVGDQKMITVGATNASRFFRLRATGP
jgi:uncharacterized delta-60 repeat protein/uncharacterized repeat protein (TIGR01451 family)